jgi:thioredoxin 1
MPKDKFQEILAGPKPVLVDFHATWCRPCHALAPIIQDFAKQMGDRVRVLKVDIDQNTALANFYRVQSVPTLILFKDGQPVWRQAGVVPKQMLVNLINDLK